MAATRASGTNAVRYGTMRENVLALTVGHRRRPRRSAPAGARARSSAGYDLTRLFVGSEGTLGIITEVTLRLHGIPEAISGGVCPFPSVEAACDAVIATIQIGIPVARIELLDALQMRAMNTYSKLDYPESADAVLRIPRQRGGRRRAGRDSFGEIAAEYGGGPFQWASDAEERTQAVEGAARRLLGRR